MGYFNTVIADGTLVERKTAALKEFDYAAWNLEQTHFADQNERDHTPLLAKVERRKHWKQRQVKKLSREYSELQAACAKGNKTYELFARLVDIEEELVNLS